MSLRTVLSAVLVAVLLLFVADSAAHFLASNSVPRQLIRKIGSAPATIHVLGIGNSLMAAGFDPFTVEQSFQQSGQRVTAVNGALGASGVIEQLLLARLAFRNHAVRTMIYGFFDDQLSYDLPLVNSDLIGNHSMLYYQEPQLTLQYANFSKPDRLAFQVYRCCALLMDRTAIWAKVEKLRRRMQEIGMPRAETNEFGRRADFALLEANTPESFERRLRQLIQSRTLLSPPAQALLQQARDHGAKVVVVEMPMHPFHVRSFYDQPIWDEYRTKIRQALAQEGATYLVASQWVLDDRLFADHLHLSNAGAVRFSQLLADYLIRHKLVGH